MTIHQKSGLTFCLFFSVFTMGIPIVYMLIEKSYIVLWPIIFSHVFAIGFVLLTANRAAEICSDFSILGGIYGLFVLLTGATGFSLTSMIVFQSSDFRSYLLKPLGWAFMFGTLPAFFTGFLFAVKASQEIKKANNTLHSNGESAAAPSP